MGHRCATGRYLLLILDPTMDDKADETIPDTAILTEPVDSYFHLSPQALTGQPSPKSLKALKFKGSIHGLSVSVLIDTGSTHNILQPRTATHLHIPHSPTQPLSVMVGNGSYIDCAGFCSSVPISLQNTLFHIPFHLFPIEGADVVLGLDWLTTLDPFHSIHILYS